MICINSRDRNKGIVATAIPPALTTANQDATISGVLAERNKTRLPGFKCNSFFKTLAIWFALSRRSWYVQVNRSHWIQMRSPYPLLMAMSKISTAQFILSGNSSSGSSKIKSGCSSMGGKLSWTKVSK